MTRCWTGPILRAGNPGRKITLTWGFQSPTEYKVEALERLYHSTDLIFVDKMAESSPNG